MAPKKENPEAKADAEDEGEGVTVDTEEQDDEFQIEVVDDTPEEDRGRPTRKDGEEAKVPTDEDLEEYSQSVQDRIKRLRYEYHTERRTREEAERERLEAIRIAQLQQRKIQELEGQINTGRKTLAEMEGTGLDARLASARSAYAKAFEDGNAEEMTKAAEEIAAVQAAKERLKATAPQESAQQAPQQQAPQYSPEQVRQMMQSQYRVPQPDPKAVRWAQKNDWFQKNPRMTAVAMSIHQELAQSGEVEVGSDEYYKKLDTEMRNEFPSYFKSGNESRTKPGNVVAPASREGGKKPRGKVTLTNTQLRIAKKLGVSPEQYAREMLAMDQE